MRAIDADAFVRKIRKLYCEDCVRRKGIKNGKMQYLYEIGGVPCRACEIEDMLNEVEDAPPIQPVSCSENPNSSDVISRQAAIDALDEQIEQCDKSLSSFDISLKDEYAVKVERASLVAFRETLEYLPPAEPEHTCVNCGRTVNNGGWYADGGTRCPIEEHYALPKDGFCHLWEKRNVTDDDYPERRTDE